MMRHTFSKILLFLLFSLLTAGVSANHSWNGYHWARTANPIRPAVNDSMTPDWDLQLTNALSEWNMSSKLDLAVISYDDSTGARKRCKMQNGQIRVCNGDYGFNGWLGLATIGIDSNKHILEGTAKMNDSYSSYWTVEEKNHVICQEIGHLFGLDHTSEDGSTQHTCMDYSSDPTSQWPNEHDYEELDIIYGHLDNFNSYDDGSSIDSGGGGCNSPAGKGCNKNGVDVPDIPMGIRIYAGNHDEIWVAPRKEGGWWIHHVYLAPKGKMK